MSALKILLTLGCWCALAIATVVNADVVENFYDVDVALESTDDVDVGIAAGLGLQNMLMRASGREDIMENEVLQQALTQANDYISQFGFIERQRDDEITQLVRFTFSQDIIEKLLNRAGEPVWTNDRPSSLVWFVIDENSELNIATQDNPHYQALLRSAVERGLPLVSPLYDLEDQFSLSAEQVWRFDTLAIREASSRYSSNVVLVMRALQDSRGLWHSSWELLDDKKSLLGSESCIRLRDCLDIASKQLAEYWSARYAVTKKYSNTDVLAVQLKNATFKSFSDLSQYWRNLSGVDDIRVVSVNGLDVNFELVWRADIKTFKQLIGLHENLRLADHQNEGRLVVEWFQ